MKRVLAGLGVVVVLVAGCGGDGGGGGETLEPSAYAAELCGSVGEWVQALQDRGVELGEGFSQDPSPKEGQEALQGFFEDVLESTDTMIAEVEDVAAPDVDEGERIHTQILDGLKSARTVLADAAERVDQLPTDDPQAFAAEAGSLGTSIQESLAEVGAKIQEAPNEELTEAFRAEESCGQINSGAGA